MSYSLINGRFLPDFTSTASYGKLKEFFCFKDISTRKAPQIGT
jgi:hypothetical protein